MTEAALDRDAALAREERLHLDSEAILLGRLGADAARLGQIAARMARDRARLDATRVALAKVRARRAGEGLP